MPAAANASQQGDAALECDGRRQATREAETEEGGEAELRRGTPWLQGENSLQTEGALLRGAPVHRRGAEPTRTPPGQREQAPPGPVWPARPQRPRPVAAVLGAPQGERAPRGFQASAPAMAPLLRGRLWAWLERSIPS